MKKKTYHILTASIILLLLANPTSRAQERGGAWTFNSRGWTTNYFTSTIWNGAAFLLKRFASMGLDKKDIVAIDRIIPESNWVFPIGFQKEGFTGENQIYGAYRRAFGNPFTNPGDFGIGFDGSYFPAHVGVYAGAYLKSQEIIFTADRSNLRALYVQPRAGLIMGGTRNQFEVGVFYDKVVGSGGTCPDTDIDRFLDGMGLDFALSHTTLRRNRKVQVLFSMPLHNFLDPRYPGQKDMKRRVGYIMSSYRIYF